MVNMVPSPEAMALAESIRAFADDRIRPIVGPNVLAAEVPGQIMTDLARMGIASPAAEDVGGQGLLQPAEMVVVAQELAKADAGIAFDVVIGAHAATFVAACGSEAQQRLAADVTGADAARRGTVLYFEGYGRGPQELQTAISESGSGWSVSGRKIAVARPADAAFGVAIGRADGHLRALLIPGDAVRASRITRDDQVTGILGLRTAHTAVTEFDGTPLPSAAPLLAGGELEVARQIAALRLSIAAVAVGVASQALSYATEYAVNRQAFGRPIAGFQGVAFPLADVSMSVESAQLGLQDVAGRLDSIDTQEDLAYTVTDALSRSMRAAEEAARVGINTLGGHGYLQDHPVERYYRDVATLAAIDFDILHGPTPTY